MSVIRKDEKRDPGARIRVRVSPDAKRGGKILRVERGKSNMHSVRETIDFRARRRKIWVTRASVGPARKFVSGVFDGTAVLRAHESAGKVDSEG